MIWKLIDPIFNRIYSSLKPINYLRRIGVTIGDDCRIFSLHPGAFGSEPYLVSVGNNVIITQGVRFITHDGSTFLFRNEYPDLDIMGPISIGNNVFIGMNTIIMPGVTIGDDCVIGAMSLVSKNIPSGSVVAGNPAKIITTIDKFKKKLLSRNCNTGNISKKTKKHTLLNLDVTIDLNGRAWKSNMDDPKN